METKSILLSASLAAGLILAGCEAQQRDNRMERRGGEEVEAVETTIRLDEVPATVRQGFEREFPGAQVKKVEKETYRTGIVHYEFEFVTREGVEMEVEFDEDGERLPEH